MLKKLLSVIGVIVALLIWAVSGQVGREVGKAAFERSPTTEKEIQNTLAQALEEAAKQINAKTPIMIDAETRMDKATVGPGALLTYHYTFPNYAANQLDPNWVQTDLRKVVKDGVCANKKNEAISRVWLQI